MENSTLDLSRICLNVGDIIPKSRSNGPGERFVIWVQGCSIRCPGCINPQFLSHEANLMMSLARLFEIITESGEIEGVTYSGGEPFEQAEALYYLSVLLKRKGLTIVSYSGFTLDELTSKEDEHVAGLLSTLDILIDGRYETDNSEPLLWRGSSNQRVHFLSERYKDYRDAVCNKELTVEVSLGEDEVSFTGNLSPGILSQIINSLKERHGIILNSK